VRERPACAVPLSRFLSERGQGTGALERQTDLLARWTEPDTALNGSDATRRALHEADGRSAYINNRWLM